MNKKVIFIPFWNIDPTNVRLAMATDSLENALLRLRNHVPKEVFDHHAFEDPSAYLTHQAQIVDEKDYGLICISTNADINIVTMGDLVKSHSDLLLQIYQQKFLTGE